MTTFAKYPTSAGAEEAALSVSQRPLRILFAAMAPPLPATNGQRIRNSNLLRALRALNHRVSIICFAESSEPRAGESELRELCDRTVYVGAPPTLSAVKQGVGRMAALFSADTYGLKRFRMPAMRAALEREFSSASFDAVLCDDVYMLSNIPNRNNVPLILNKHDLTFEIVNRFSGVQRNIAKKLYGYLEGSKVRKIEFRAADRADAVWACSERDKSILEAGSPSSRVFVVPNAIDTSEYASESVDDGRTILYAGAMDWLPNRDAVAFFLQEIYPRIRQQMPEARFVVAGRNPPADFCRQFAAVPGVRFTGFVDSLQEEFAKSTVCVVPLRIGSGTRLKILEASAAGKPVVSTTIGAEGLGLVAEEDILLANNAEHFAASVIKLLESPDLRREISKRAQQKVYECYSITALQRAVQSAVNGSVNLVEKTQP